MTSDYSSKAKEYFDRYESQVPHRLYELCRTFFYPGEPTVDIGCGSGRDVQWLKENNYPAEGYDSAEELLKLAKDKRPHLNFTPASLPELNSIGKESYLNLLCSGVLMHLPQESHLPALFNLLRVLRAGGRAIVSIRNPANDPRGFHQVKIEQVQFLLEGLGAKILLIDKSTDAYRSEVHWTTIVFEKGQDGRAQGLKRLQSIIQEDKRTATYKLALIRALCSISRYEGGNVVWSEEYVQVSAARVAHYWARYYYGLLKAGIGQNSGGKPAFTSILCQYRSESELLLALDNVSKDQDIKKTLKKISSVILDMPVKHIGGEGHYGLFKKIAPQKSNDFQFSLGFIEIPSHIWRDISKYAYWIEDSLILEWARMTARLNDHDPKSFEKCLGYLNKDLEAVRDTKFAKKILLKNCNTSSVECVWSGKKVDLKKADYELDHMLPFAYWRNNDLWNLLPATPSINGQKSAKVPTPDLLLKCRERIFFYWDIYEKAASETFRHQRESALYFQGMDSHNWKKYSFDGLCFLAERGIKTYGLGEFNGD